MWFSLDSFLSFSFNTALSKPYSLQLLVLLSDLWPIKQAFKIKWCFNDVFKFEDLNCSISILVMKTQPSVSSTKGNNVSPKSFKNPCSSSSVLLFFFKIQFRYKKNVNPISTCQCFTLLQSLATTRLKFPSCFQASTPVPLGILPPGVYQRGTNTWAEYLALFSALLERHVQTHVH